MHVRNRTSRYHVVIQAAQKVARRDPHRSAKAEEIIVLHERKIREHQAFITEEGRDPDDITNWTWHG